MSEQTRNRKDREMMIPYRIEDRIVFLRECKDREFALKTAIESLEAVHNLKNRIEVSLEEAEKRISVIENRSIESSVIRSFTRVIEHQDKKIVDLEKVRDAFHAINGNVMSTEEIERIRAQVSEKDREIAELRSEDERLMMTESQALARANDLHGFGNVVRATDGEWLWFEEVPEIDFSGNWRHPTDDDDFGASLGHGEPCTKAESAASLAVEDAE